MKPRAVKSILFVILVMILSGCGGKVKLPHDGVFYMKAGELVELPQSNLSSLAVGPGDPTIERLTVIYLKYPIPSVESLHVLGLPEIQGVPLTLTYRENGFVEIEINQELAPGDYCLVAGDYWWQLGEWQLDDSSVRWCFRIGERPAVMATGAEPSVVPTGLDARYRENRPQWKLLAYDLSYAPGDPGWNDYKARLAYQALVPLVQGRLEVGGGYVLTAEGNQYPAVIVRADTDDPGPTKFNPGLGTLTLTDHERTVYEPGIPVGHVPGVAIRGHVAGEGNYARVKEFWLSFRVPESLTPESVHFPGFEPIVLDSLPPRLEAVSQDYHPTYVPGSPIQLTQVITMRLSAPRKYVRERDELPVLGFDVELTNSDVTADRQVAFIVSMVDSTGILDYSPFIYCQESDLHYSDIGSGSYSTLLGPGQTQKGVFCALPWSEARRAGPFVVMVTGGERYTNPNPTVHTFRLDVD